MWRVRVVKARQGETGQGGSGAGNGVQWDGEGGVGGFLCFSVTDCNGEPISTAFDVCVQIMQSTEERVLPRLLLLSLCRPLSAFTTKVAAALAKPSLSVLCIICTQTSTFFIVMTGSAVTGAVPLPRTGAEW